MSVAERIQEIKVKSHNTRDKTYKLELVLSTAEESASSTELIKDSIKVNIQWKKVIQGFRKIKKDLNVNIYNKLVYDISNSVIIKDKKYSDAKKFLYGIPFSRNKRKVSDVQLFFNELLKHKEGDNSSAVNCLFNKLFNALD